MKRMEMWIMSDTYVECLVKAKQSPIAKVGYVLLMILTVLLVILGLLVWYFLFAAIVAGVGAYFLKRNSNIEYEYLYLDKEIMVDKILNQVKRKRIATYSVDRIEILAPIKSYHLDNYKNRQATVKDYSVREELQPDERYVMFYEGGEKVILNPSEAMLKALRNVAPRKVFLD